MLVSNSRIVLEIVPLADYHLEFGVYALAADVDRLEKEPNAQQQQGMSALANHLNKKAWRYLKERERDATAQVSGHC